LPCFHQQTNVEELDDYLKLNMTNRDFQEVITDSNTNYDKLVLTDSDTNYVDDGKLYLTW
jgi:uncharacterized protein YeeX (DUF496 family)